VARQVEEWSGARSTRVERSDRPASALFVELRGFDALVEHLGDDEARSLTERCVERARQIQPAFAVTERNAGAAQDGCGVLALKEK
jgi:hypothetical protein